MDRDTVRYRSTEFVVGLEMYPAIDLEPSIQKL
jgi:hypothetical protein